MRSKFRTASIVIVVLLAVAIAIYFALHSRPVKHYVLEQVQNYLRSGQGVILHADDLEYDLFSLSITLRDVELRSAQAPDLPPLFAVQRAYFRVGFLNLLRDFIHIEESSLEGIVVHVFIDEQGRSNIFEAPEGPEEQEPSTDTLPRILVSSLSALGRELVFEDRRHLLRLELIRWTLDIHARAPETEHQIRFFAPEIGEVRYGDQRLPIRRLLLNGSVLLYERAEIENLELALDGLEVQAAGEMDDFEDPTFHLNAEGRLDLEELRRFAGIEETLDGTLQASFEIGDRWEDLSIAGEFTGRNVAVSGFSGIEFRALSEWSGESDRLAISSISLESPAFALSGGAELALGGGPSRLNANVRRADLSRLIPAASGGIELAARASGTIQANWPGMNWEVAQGMAQVRLDATQSSPSGTTEARALPLSARMRVEFYNNVVRVNLPRALALGASLSGNIQITSIRDLTEVTRGTIAGNLAGEIENVETLSENLSYFLEQPSLREAEIAGPARFTADLAGRVSRPSISAQLSAPNLRVGDMQDVALEASVAFEPELLRLEDLRLAWREQRIAARGEIGLGEESPSLDLQLGLENTSVESILAGAGQDLPLKGIFNVQARVQGSVESPQGGMELHASNLEAYQQPLGTLSARVQATASAVQVEEFVLEKAREGGTDRLVATGSVDLDSRRFEADVRLESFHLTSLVLPENLSVRGQLAFSLEGEGEIDNPSLDLKARVENLSLDRRGLGQITLAAALNDRNLRVQTTVPKFNLAAQGGIQTEAPYPVRLEVTAQDTDIVALSALANREGVEGSLSGVVTASGDLESWQQSRVSAHVRSLRLVAGEQEIVNEGPIRVEYENEVVSVESLTLASTLARFSVEGRMPVRAEEEEGSLALSGSLALEPLLHVLAPEQEIYVQGDATLNGTIRGSFEAPAPSLTLDLSNGFVQLPEREVSVWTALQAQVETPKPGLENIQGTVRFRELQLQVADARLGQDGETRLALRRQTLRIDHLRMRGLATQIEVSGQWALAEARRLDFQMQGNLDTGILSAALEDLSTAGNARIQIQVQGSPSDPSVAGTIEWRQGEVSLAEPRILASDLNMLLQFRGRDMIIERFTGVLNGGPFTIQGNAAHGPDRPSVVNVSISGENIFMDFPENLQTISNLQLSLNSRDENIVLGGQVTIEEGSYTEQINIEDELLRLLQSDEEIELVDERNPLLSQLRFDIAVETAGPIFVNNNLAQLGLTLDLQVVGDYYRPGLTGRIDLEEGGEIFLRERTYFIERGVVTFISEARIEPFLDLVARTEVRQYDITLQVNGTPDNIETTLTADDPSLSEPDIMALLVTGRKLEELRGAGGSVGMDVAGEQALSYLTGAFGGRIARGLEEATGLSRVRIEPALIAGESDPTARLTVGQAISRDLGLIYSVDLRESSDQIYIAEYDLTRRFNTRVSHRTQSESDAGPSGESEESYRAEFRHEIRFGGSAAEARAREARREGRRIGEIRFSGEPRFSPQELMDRLEVERGDEYDFFEVRRSRERLYELYHDRDYLEARVRLNQERRDLTVDLNWEIEAGPGMSFRFSGADISGDLRKQVENAWMEGVFDGQRVEEATRSIQGWFRNENYLGVEVDFDISESENRKEVRVAVRPGPEYEEVDIHFSGAEGIPSERLREALEETDLLEKIHVEPREIRDFLSDFYRLRGYLEADVSLPEYDLQPERRVGRVVIPVQEGPLFRVEAIRFEGNSAASADQLMSVIPLAEGQVYRPDQREESVRRLQEFYASRGYLEAEVSYALERSPESGSVILKFHLKENRQQVVAGIEVRGNDRTSDDLVGSQLQIAPGDILTFEKLGQARRQLYNTGAFSLVEIWMEDTDSATITGGPEKPVNLIVQTREVEPYRLRYGGFYDTERQAGLVADIENRNSLGSARVLGLATRYDQEVQEVRTYFSQPLLRRLPLKTSVSAFLRREYFRQFQEPFITDSTGISIEQEFRLKEDIVLAYGYRFSRAHTFLEEPDPFLPFDIILDVAPLTFTLTRENRDDMLDASRGSFTSHALEYATSTLGSDLRMLKYFGQFFRYFPLSDAEEIPWVGIRKPRLVYATGFRVGLATGLGGQELIPSERFFAGGGTSVRGFEQDSIGPRDELGPMGGDALFVLNNELRFPLIGFFDGVAFLDAGNVYPSVGDFDPFRLRAAAGLGLRVRTPFFLLRADYGFKLSRRPGESPGAFFFSIGQAF